jgi:hypothetical protein
VPSAHAVRRGRIFQRTPSCHVMQTAPHAPYGMSVRGRSYLTRPAEIGRCTRSTPLSRQECAGHDMRFHIFPQSDPRRGDAGSLPLMSGLVSQPKPPSDERDRHASTPTRPRGARNPTRRSKPDTHTVVVTLTPPLCWLMELPERLERLFVVGLFGKNHLMESGGERRHDAMSTGDASLRHLHRRGAHRNAASWARIETSLRSKATLSPRGSLEE